MSWSALATGIVALIEADTGSGGLFEVGGANKITGIYNTVAPQTQTQPYIVFTNVSAPEIKSFDTDAVEYTVQFDIYAPWRTDGKTVTAIADRLRTVIDRVAPSLTGWTADFGQIVNSRGPEQEDDMFRMGFDWELIITKD